MPFLRDLARRAVSKALGVNADPPAPPKVRFDRVSPAVKRVNAEIAAAVEAARDVAPAAPNVPMAKAIAEGAVADSALAEALATMTCGAQELKERIGAGEPVTVLDVREPFELLAGIMPNALRIPLAELPTRWREVESANEIVCYCPTGERSLEAAKLLRENGLFNATSLDGGLAAWLAVSGELVRPGTP